MASAGVPVAPSSNDTPTPEGQTNDKDKDKDNDNDNGVHNGSSPRSEDSWDRDIPVKDRRAIFAGGARPSRVARASKTCGGLGEKVKRWASRVPMNKVKILVVVWQILTVFPSVSGVDYPGTYSRFLSWMDVVNFDLGTILSASCLVGTVNL